MSRMMRSNFKPPLPRSPIALRSRGVLQSTSNVAKTPPGSLTKTLIPNRPFNVEELELRPEYQTISCELRALAKKVQDEFKDTVMVNSAIGNSSNPNQSPLFERGRFYEEYSARRNERLKRKKGFTGFEKKTAAHDLGVRVESAKRKETKKFESLRNSVSSTPVPERTQAAPRYSLRSSNVKENKKQPLAASFDKSVGGKIGVRRVRKV